MKKLSTLTILASLWLILQACGNGGKNTNQTDSSSTGKSVMKADSATHSKTVTTTNNESSENQFPENDQNTDLEKTGLELLKKDGLGKLKIGLDIKQVVDMLGPPFQKTKAQFWGADGGYHSDWIYVSKGIVLNINRIPDHPDKKYHLNRVEGIVVESPCKLRTQRNIGIGSTRQEVLKAYQKAIAKPQEKGRLLAGSYLGGITFTFQDNKVSKIFFGAELND